jgi:hypothetical protein
MRTRRLILRREIVYFISGIILGYAICFIGFSVFTVAYADELPVVSGSEEAADVYDREDVPDEEAEPDDLEVEEPEEDTPGLRPYGNGDPERSEVGPRDRGGERRAVTREAAPAFSPIQPLASGMIIAELMDLMNPPIENNGFTAVSWEQYELAMAAAWDVVFNFMDYDDLEVLMVIIRLRAAIDDLEYLPGMEPPAEIDFEVFAAVGFGGFLGGFAGLAFMDKWQPGV